MRNASAEREREEKPKAKTNTFCAGLIFPLYMKGSSISIRTRMTCNKKVSLASERWATTRKKNHINFSTGNIITWHIFEAENAPFDKRPNWIRVRKISNEILLCAEFLSLSIAARAIHLKTVAPQSYWFQLFTNGIRFSSNKHTFIFISMPIFIRHKIRALISNSSYRTISKYCTLLSSLVHFFLHFQWTSQHQKKNCINFK